jgi:hypothetical protein
MKKQIILFGIALTMAFSLDAQTNAPAAVQLSHKIAKKMKDTLDLSAQQRQDIYQVNMNLHNQKQAIRQQNPPPDSLSARIQRVEKTRDSLYLPIIGQAKYQLYLQKKRNLISNN